MIICKSLNLVYFSIPRTGSTAMERLLLSHYDGVQMGEKHSKYSSLTPEDQVTLASYVKVAGIRNPFDSLFSQYKKKQSNHREKKNGKMALNLRAENWSFPRFIHACAEQGTLNTFARQERNTLRHMDTLIRFENMQEDWQDLCQRQGWEHLPIPVVNQTAKQEGENYQAHCDPASIALIREHCRAFLDKYSYDF